MFKDIKTNFQDIVEGIRKDRITQIFLLILIFGSIIRYWGITNAENADEYNEVFEALRIASGHLNINRWLKKGYQTLLAGEYGVYFLLGWIAGVFKSPMHFASAIVADMSPLFLIGRATTATLGILSIIVTYLIGKNMFNRRVGLISALFFSVIPMHVWVSHLVNTDVPMTFFSLLALLFIWGVATNGKVYSYALAGFFIAIAINCKMLAVPLIVPFLASHFFNWNKHDKTFTRFIISKEIGYTSLFFVIGFILSNPAIIVGLPKFIDYFFYRTDLYSNYDKFGAIPYSQNAYYDYYAMLKDKEFGLPLFIIAVFGILYSVVKRQKADYILCPLCIAHFLLISNTNFLVQDRYMMLLVPPLLILAARFMIGMVEKIRSKTIANAILVIICVLCVIFPTYKSLKYVISLTGENTSKISKKWIEENIPDGSKILLDAGKTMITFGPRLNQSREKIYSRIKEIKKLKEGETFDSIHVRMVDSYSAIYFELLLETDPKISYDITSTELGTKLESVEYYRNNNFDYIIHNEGLNFRLKDPNWRRQYPKPVEFYESLDGEFELIKTIPPTRINSGSTIKIYKVR